MGFLAKYLVLPSSITAAQLALIPDSMEEAVDMADRVAKIKNGTVISDA